MSTPRTTIDTSALYAAFDRHAGNKSLMAQELGVHRDTVRRVMSELGLTGKPLVSGDIKPKPTNVLPLPPAGKVTRYIVTSAQNNTSVFKKFLVNLEAYCAYLSDISHTVGIMVSRFTYNKNAFENKFMSKPGTSATEEDAVWYDPLISRYICDDVSRDGSCHYRLAPDLEWCAEMNVIPTAERPLSGLDTYAGNASAIFPHAKVALRSMPRMKKDHARLLYTTGTVTQLNYIQRKAGQKAQHHHVFGALIVEVNSTGDWWVRQLNADRNGSFYDCPEGQVLRVVDGAIQNGLRAEAINWGDIHASEIDTTVQEVNWGKNGAIDALRPKYQFYNDLFSMRSRSHHEMKSFGRMYEKFLTGQDSVSLEVEQTAAFMHFAHRDWCIAVVVNSNHDRHGERWLDEADYKHDLPNVEFFLEAQLTRCRAIKAQDARWSFLEWSLRRANCPETTFLCLDDSYIIGPKSHPVECGLHGDLGPNGSRGSPSNLRTLGLRNNQGHIHGCAIDGPVYAAGVCQLDLRYNHGPSNWSHSHVLTYRNGKRCMLTQRAEKLWA